MCRIGPIITPLLWYKFGDGAIVWRRSQPRAPRNRESNPPSEIKDKNPSSPQSESRDETNVKKNAGAINRRIDSFPIVAVGASAGGLEAFTQFLQTLPDNTGMAFVFIQHLDPTHPSILSELLAKSSNMPVVEVKKSTTVQRNYVYVIPPNVNMAIARRRLQLSPRTAEPGRHTPIDFFMRSLADEENSGAIGVVLSGAGADGARGLTAIKAEGGITFAQDEKSARYADMPHNAVAAGCVDFILPPDKIALELARISGHPYLNGHQSPVRRGSVATPKRFDENFGRIFVILKRAGGVDFSLYKVGTVQRRTLRRMAIQRIDHVSDYAKFLEKHPKETEQLCQDLLIPVTSFFRDLKAFESLKSKAFPAILKDKSSKKGIRIWAPGCSTGEETYSLAMLLLEFLGDQASSFHIQLFGTDVNERGIEKARAGFYQERISQEMSPDRLRRFFTRAEGGYRINKSVRDLCVFAKQNLAEDPPFSNMHVVACRNLLIYLAPELQRKVVPILHYALRPSGFLFLGNAESISGFQEFFAPVDKGHKIFVKKVIASRPHYDFVSQRYPRETSIANPITRQSERHPDADHQNEADQIVLKSYGPPGLVITENMEIVEFRGAIGQYIEPVSGRATLSLLKIVRSEFVSELRTAVNQAKKSHMPVKRKSVEFRRKRQPRSVSISVEPLGKSTETPQGYLVLFERSFPAVPAPKTIGGKVRGTRRAAKEENARLRRKLAEADEHIRALVESKEASDEEYQSTNEEILSANEELQSTSEELETTKEEMQSTNEELNTVNEELRRRNADLDRLSSDLKNVLASTSLPVVMVDRSLTVRQVTPVAAKSLKIRPSDVGRPITDIRSDINIPNLDQLIGSVIETLTPKELEVQTAEGHWYSLHIRPYRTSEDKIDGAVVVLSDTDVAKRASELVRISKEFFEHSLDTVREPLMVFAEDLRIQYVNPSFLRVFQVSQEETIGHFLYNLGNGQWKIPQLQTQLEEVLSKDTPMIDFEVDHEFPKLGKRTMVLNGRRIKSGHLGEPIILLAIEDITERKRAEQILQQTHDRLESLVENRTASLRKLSADMIHLQDEERRKISRELHDSVGQYLAYAKLKVETLKKTDENEAEAITHIAETLDKCLTETRTLSHLLHPPFLEEVGFRSAAEWYLEGFAERTGIRVNVDMPSEQKRLLHGPIELILFRILQESLTNIHRHSQSPSVNVHLRFDTGKVIFEIRDYGKGIPHALLERFRETGGGVGVGLSSMRERVGELGGEFEIQSNGGTLIRVVFPMPTASDGKASSRRCSSD